MKLKIKVCGMRDGENIRQVSELGVEYIGMIFWDKSPRNVTMIPTHAGIIPDRAAEIARCACNSPLNVGVFVDEMPQNIITRVVNFHLDIIQMHGHETPTLIRNLRATIDPDIRPGIQIWKAISIPTASVSHDHFANCNESKQTLNEVCKPYEDCVDAFVFDTQTPNAGGSGQHFDWSVLEAYDGEKPFLLSGGISPDDAERISQFHHPKCIGIDLNSRFETEPGIKDVDALRKFIDQLNKTA